MFCCSQGAQGEQGRFPREVEAEAAPGTSPEDEQRCLQQDQTGDEQGNEGQNKGPEHTGKPQGPECESHSSALGLPALSSPQCKTDPTIPPSVPVPAPATFSRTTTTAFPQGQSSALTPGLGKPEAKSQNLFMCQWNHPENSLCHLQAAVGGEKSRDIFGAGLTFSICLKIHHDGLNAAFLVLPQPFSFSPAHFPHQLSSHSSSDRGCS